MKTKLTYTEKDLPIKSAEFMSSGCSKCEIIVYHNSVDLIFGNKSNVNSVRSFNNADFHDLARIITRIDKQING